MALFSQDLFEVFEEKTEPVSLTGKKRKRIEEKKEKGGTDGQKRAKAAAEAASTSAAAGPSTSNEVVDLTVDDEEGENVPEEIM